MKTFFSKNSRGQAMIIGIMFLLFSSFILIFGISTPLLADLRILGNLKNRNQSFFAAEGALEDAVLRIRKGDPIGSTSTILLNSAEVTTVVVDIPGGKDITSEGNSNGRIKKVRSLLTIGDGVAFHYGIQTGNGGFILGGNAGVYGNVYSNGNITGSNGAFITGSALAADSAAVSADQSNVLPVPPSGGTIFGTSNSNQDIAQKFVLSQTGKINKVRLNLRKIGSAANLNIRIVTDQSGSPSNQTLAESILSSSLVTTEFGFVEVVFQSNPNLMAGTSYWLVLDGVTSSSRYYEWASNNMYAPGQLKTGLFGSTWSSNPVNMDGYFEIYLGGVPAVIDNVDVGTSGQGDAHANSVTNSSIAGKLYCKIGSGNNKACDTTLNNPSPQPYPISEANVDSWKSDAEEGGIYIGNMTISTSSSYGPKKIEGDLIIANGATLELVGTIWVTGNLIVQTNGGVSVSPLYGETGGVLMADGYIELSNNVSFSGSGEENSYLLLLTTSDCPQSAYCAGKNAISVQNNASAVILNAQNGTISFANNAGANAATAHILRLSNNATITYRTGLSNLSFSSGPSGGYEINGWSEVE